jgi:hypothetical protein
MLLMMVRLLYAFFSLLLLASCSGSGIARYSAVPMLDTVHYGMSVDAPARELFPLHYSAKLGEDGSVGELSYSFMRYSGDTAFWEEGVVRFP